MPYTWGSIQGLLEGEFARGTLDQDYLESIEFRKLSGETRNNVIARA